PLVARLRPPPMRHPRFATAAAPPAATSTLSLHAALPIYRRSQLRQRRANRQHRQADNQLADAQRLGDRHGAFHQQVRTANQPGRSEEHTSELQSRENLVCRLLLDKKKLRSKMVLEKRIGP